MSKKQIPTQLKPSSGVTLGQGQKTYDAHPVFSFEDFHLEAINIPDSFNNHFKDPESYRKIISNLFGKGLQLLSIEKVDDLLKSRSKQGALHFHKITDKEDIIEKILRTYQFNDSKINNILEGDNLYQFEIPYENGATRVVFQVIDSVFSLLFLDTNHHIYFNKTKVERAGSLFFEECPINNAGHCERLEYWKTCFAFEFLDVEKIKETYGNGYDGTKNG